MENSSNPNDLAYIRSKLGITQSAMADALGLSLRAYQGLEKGERLPKQMHILAAKSLLENKLKSEPQQPKTAGKISSSFIDIFKKIFIGSPSSYESTTIERLPASLWEHVRKYILNDPIYRENLAISFSLSVAEKYGTGQKWVYINYEIQQVIRNISNSKYKYPIRLDLERGKASGEDVNSIFSNFQLFINNQPIKIRPGKNSANVSQEIGVFYRYDHEVVMEPNESVSVGMNVREIKQPLSGFEVWRTKHCCQNLSFSIRFPPDIEVLVDSLHPAPIKILHKSETTLYGQISEPLLPHNGIMFWWRPR